MSRTQWDDGLHVVNSRDAPEAVLPGQRVPKEPASTIATSTYPQYSPLVQPYSSGQQDQEQRGHFLPRSGASSPGLEKATPKRRICGLRRSTFFLTVALLAVMVIAAVGGGVGGSIAVKNAKSSASRPSISASTTVFDQLTSTTLPSSTTTAPSTTTASIITVPTEGVLAFDCAAVASSGRQIITLDSLSWGFGVSCNQDFWGSGIDVAGLIAYSFEDCLHSCAQTNRITKNDTCVGVSFDGDLPLSMEKDYGNCFLKKYLVKPTSYTRPLGAVASLVSSPYT